MTPLFSQVFFFSFFWVFLIIKECHKIVKDLITHNYGVIQACALNYDHIKIHIKKNNFHEFAFSSLYVFLFSLEYTDFSQNYSVIENPSDMAEGIESDSYLARVSSLSATCSFS